MEPSHSPSLYWAGDRGFRSCTRWHDEMTIACLTEKHCWHVLYPFDESIPVDESACRGFFGIRGSLRRRCLTGIDSCDVVAAYLGTYDTGTAQEIEYALIQGKPILGWNDSAVVVGEHAGRELTVTQEEIASLEVAVLPLNGMTAVIDRYIEFSRLGTGTAPDQLADRIDREARLLLTRSTP